MFARLFPTNPKQIIEESFLGILKSMILLPIQYYGPDIGEGFGGTYIATSRLINIYARCYIKFVCVKPMKITINCCHLNLTK